MALRKNCLECFHCTIDHKASESSRTYVHYCSRDVRKRRLHDPFHSVPDWCPLENQRRHTDECFAILERQVLELKAEIQEIKDFLNM